MGISTAVWLGWLAIFGALEVPAILHKVPWTSMSQWTWHLEAHWWPLPWLIIVALGFLTVHLAAGKY
jgi:hypothetical protein